MNNYPNSIRSAIRYVVPPLLLCSSGFIFSMLWFTLMADTRAAGIATEVIPATILASIIGFYRVIFGPMTWLVKVFILLMLLSMALQLSIKAIPWYIRYIIFITNAPPVFMAVFYIIPLTDRFIEDVASPEIQSQFARTIHTAHIISASCVAFMIVLQLFTVIHLQRQGNRA